MPSGGKRTGAGRPRDEHPKKRICIKLDERLIKCISYQGRKTSHIANVAIEEFFAKHEPLIYKYIYG